ncbi:unnamed protein product [Hermetia illucens]|uniref:Uncharacterized protein n=1 Tax=Hermetia illucens TaxID=343691 RepID=A0A7R8Z1C9_HERIL|nr:zinc finger protein 568-like [Hermetia illucens]CAD7093394.1 unnamed protein product [Hermetia illucens]
MDTEDLCRTCLETENPLVPLFEEGKPSVISSESGTLVDLLRSLSGIEISSDDGLPLQICTFCIGELQRLQTFKLKCQKSETTLLKLKEAKLLLVRLTEGTADSSNVDMKPNTSFIKDEIIDILDDDEEEDDEGPNENTSYDDDVPLIESYEAGYDMDEEMIEKMTNDDLAELSGNSETNTEVMSAELESVNSEKTKKVVNNKKKVVRKFITKFDPSTLRDFETSSNEKELKCPGCSEIFTKLDSLRAHIMEIHTKGEVCYLCDPASGLQVTDIWKHCIDHLPKKHMCPACGKRFIKRTYLRAHMKLTHSGLRREIFHCKLCSKTFKTRSGISYHRQVAHAVEKPYACEICSARFAHIKLLRLHMLSYHTDGPPKCKFCGQCFNAYSTMIKHVRRQHSGVNKQRVTNAMQSSFKCAICSQQFAEKHTLEAHVISSHTNFRQFKCTHCPFSFKFKSVMGIHMSTHHPNAVTEDISTDCEICSKSLRSQDSLATHMSNVHTNTRPYLCVFCSYSFKIESNLESHISNIHSQRVGHIEYKCDECDSLFYSRDNLLEHKELTHNTNVQAAGNSEGSYDATDYIFRTMFE